MDTPSGTTQTQANTDGYESPRETRPLYARGDSPPPGVVRPTLIRRLEEE